MKADLSSPSPGVRFPKVLCGSDPMSDVSDAFFFFAGRLLALP